jgi:hypothetical protein
MYAVSFIGLFIVILSFISLVNLGLKLAFFKDSDFYPVSPYEKMLDDGSTVIVTEEEQLKEQVENVTRQRQRDLSQAIAQILVGLPVYLYHWSIIKKDSEKRNKD